MVHLRLSKPMPPTPPESPTKTRQPMIKDTMAGASEGAQGAFAGRDRDDPETVLGCGDVLSSDVMSDGPACYRSGRANFHHDCRYAPLSGNRISARAISLTLSIRLSAIA